MDSLTLINEEIKKYGMEVDCIEITSDKAGIIVAKLKSKKSYVMKVFSNEYVREIQIYKLFKDLGIKTINVVGEQERSILFEDIDSSVEYRLAKADDMKDARVMKSLSMWYKNLHKAGKYASKYVNFEFYSETEEIIIEELDLIRQRSAYNNDRFWKSLEHNLEWIKQYVRDHQTLNYNDFNYTNMIISTDYEEAFMFDYNLVGVGLECFDVRNVMSNPYISEEIAMVFKNEFHISEFQTELDNVIGHLATLVFAYRKKDFPTWANDSLVKLKDGTIACSLDFVLSCR